jgi:hypothetical protein
LGVSPSGTRATWTVPTPRSSNDFAADNGEARYHLGLAYLNGDGVQQDFVEAYFWLTVCSNTKGVFWSPSPDELAAEASLHIPDEAVLGDTLNRVVLWLAKHGSPVPDDD